MELYLHSSCILWRPQEHLDPYFSVCWDRTVAQAVSRRPSNAEAGLKFQDRVCEILWWANSHWDRFCQSTSLSPCQHYFTSHLHTSIHNLQYTCRVLAVDSVVKPTPIKPIHLYHTIIVTPWPTVLFAPRIWIQF